MKVRSGFVSNSSSSSFILIGVALDKDSPILKAYKENDYELPEEFKSLDILSEVYINGVDYLYGEYIDSEDGGTLDVSIIEEVKSKMPEDLKDKVKIWYGTYGC